VQVGEAGFQGGFVIGILGVDGLEEFEVARVFSAAFLRIEGEVALLRLRHGFDELKQIGFAFHG
jgi:hypothetical protein